jgi:hypothetical protein
VGMDIAMGKVVGMTMMIMDYLKELLKNYILCIGMFYFSSSTEPDFFAIEAKY